jgi:pimeloyl-ACP methyl ester carboxylesterase
VNHADVGDISIGYEILGPLRKGPATAGVAPARPLMLITGSSGTLDGWPPAFIAALAGDRQVIVFDNRGMGETTNPMGAYPFSQLADDTAGLVGALGHESVDVLGWSMGGNVAIDLAVRHPEVVGSLISYAGGAGGSEAVPPTPEALAVLTDTSGAPEERGMRLLELLFLPEYRVAHPDYWRLFPVPQEETDPAQIGLQNAAIGEWAGVWDGLGRIRKPALFVTGTEDVITPQENAVMMTNRVPGSWLVRLAGAGHGLMYQDPQRLAAIVLAFLG